MATATVAERPPIHVPIPVPATPTRSPVRNGNGLNREGHHDTDVFSSHVHGDNGSVSDGDDAGDISSFDQARQHRFSRLRIEPADLSNVTSPAQLKRTIEAHLQETDRRLLDTQHLGNSLLKQRDDLTSRLEEVEQFQDEATIPPELRRKLADIEKEHADVGREVARALIGPKQKAEESHQVEPGVFSSQATGSPTKISAPSRRHRNQPSTRAGDLQFAADISTSLLAQVRQLQAAVADRDETIRRSHADREAIDNDLIAYTQKIRALDESEQKYKDENWNLETQKHDLLTAAKLAADKEKRLNAGLNLALSEKSKLQNELDEWKSSHTRLSEEHHASRKAHDTEIHSLKRSVDAADTDRQTLQNKVEELVSQNHELARAAAASRSRSRQISPGHAFLEIPDDVDDKADTPDDSPPPSPTKATPRHGGLESETLKSSLHHAHRMIQNLKGNIHREKTEKTELKRMLQDARDELETRRSGDTGSAAKRPKTRPEPFKKPTRPDMLGGNRRSRTDVELTDDDWEDQYVDSPSHVRSALHPANNHISDLSDAYQTANDTEGNFDTADEQQTTESEAFMTGAESLPGDSTDELTETEEVGPQSARPASGRVGRSIPPKSTDRAMNLNSGSDGEPGDMKTPMQPFFTKFKLRKNRASQGTPVMVYEQPTPESVRSQSSLQDSPATVLTSQSPMVGEQSLFAELGGVDDFHSEANSTPARSSIVSSTPSTPGFENTPSKKVVIRDLSGAKLISVDAEAMTDGRLDQSQSRGLETPPRNVVQNNGNLATGHVSSLGLLPSEFPPPFTVPVSPERKYDSGAHHTPQRALMESPIRPKSSHITPPKTVWDAVDETENGNHTAEMARIISTPLAYSSVLSQNSVPVLFPDLSVDLQRQLHELNDVHQKRESEMIAMGTSHAAAIAIAHEEIGRLKTSHSDELKLSQTQIAQLESDAQRRQAELHALQTNHESALTTMRNEADTLRALHSRDTDTLKQQIETNEQSLEQAQRDSEQQLGMHAAALKAGQTELETQKSSHVAATDELKTQISGLGADLIARQTELEALRKTHDATLAAHDAKLERLKVDHAQQAAVLNSQLEDHSRALLAQKSNIEILQNSHSTTVGKLNERIVAHQADLDGKTTELGVTRTAHIAALASMSAQHESVKSHQIAEHEKLQEQVSGLNVEMEKKRIEIDQLRTLHREELGALTSQISSHDKQLGSKETELESLQNVHNTQLDNFKRQIASYENDIRSKHTELEASKQAYDREIAQLQMQNTRYGQDLTASRLETDHARSLHKQDSERLTAQSLALGAVIESKSAEVSGLQARITEQATQLAQKADQVETVQKLRENDRATFEIQQLEQKNKTSQALQQFEQNRDEHQKLITAKATEIETLQAAHQQVLLSKALELQTAQDVHQQELSGRLAQHNDVLTSHKQVLAAKQAELDALADAHQSDVLLKTSELESAQSTHAKELSELRKQIDASSNSLILLKTEHDRSMSQVQSTLASKSQELQSLQSELVALKARLYQMTPAFSGIVCQEILPTSSKPMTNGLAPSAERSASPERPRTAERIGERTLLVTAASGAGFALSNSLSAEDDVFGGSSAKRTIRHDQLESATEPERDILAVVTVPPPNRGSRIRNPGSPSRLHGRSPSRTRGDVYPIVEDSDFQTPASPTYRPSSANSTRTSSYTSQNHPPLPSNHRVAIARANSQAESPTRRESTTVKPGGMMGPPLLPASAMRRPNTPSGSVRTASRISQNGKRGIVGSQASRRSSVSSFASELDERFNIRANQQMGVSGFSAGPGTDPRMIQAITQTMIGEFLWKYTRKAGSKEMSTTRHRRYFWVHPYTKTLYWSDQDPQTAGRTEVKVKSVQIESVRAVSDDNPMPPGLHRKSLEVTTPGRKVKFTASTGQRHETWFNALSYLLQRGDPAEKPAVDASAHDEITPEDVAEFSVNGYGARLLPNDRMSMSSYNSRGTTGTSRRIGQTAPPLNQMPSSSLRAPPNSEQAFSESDQDITLEPPLTTDKDRTLRASSRSRISRMLGSVSNRTKSETHVQSVDTPSRVRGSSSIYDASVVSDSRYEQEAEEAKRQLLQEQKPGLEDVRACCDGKHNVSSLKHRHPPNPSTGRLSSAFNRSMSRRN